MRVNARREYTGDRSIFSGDDTGDGLDYHSLLTPEYDPELGILYVLDRDYRGILTANDWGDRVLFSR